MDEKKNNKYENPYKYDNPYDNSYHEYIKNTEQGDAGKTTIIASNDIILDDGASIVSVTFGGGNAGMINLKGKTLEFGGLHKDNYVYHYFKRHFLGSRNRDFNNGVIATVVEPRSPQWTFQRNSTITLCFT